ncbi:SDR family NAD(P)-dependent oxidoreductase [Prosthecodimorpha staleyi]|uniref:SDR family oxidoreductase n=1 Tax=Prosthecodimorpha staleyi TaxID=2840188 RepID=A0A947D622_9HYPH|nr:SDR family NAD(P)-dependent oxidoreductase [Prosthecodimorpha staleyi]MBT9291541.1 SDR family oxidoreductase [Prosthecodimorpha staleyi]
MSAAAPARRLDGRVHLVTGAARGIGAAVARRLSAEGAAIAAADLDADGLAALAADLEAAGTAVLTGRFDSRDSAATDRFVAETVERFGRLDGAVPCAGIARAARAEEMTDAAFADVLGINLTGVFYTCRAVGRVLLARGEGAIVTVASITARGGQPGRANYAASKWGLVGLTKTLALEWGGRGVRVNAVAPNGVDTPMIRDGIPPDFLDGVMLDRTPLGRLARPEEVAAVIAFLLGPDASYVNGAVVEVDGGLTAGFLTARHGTDFASRTIPPPPASGQQNRP